MTVMRVWENYHPGGAPWKVWAAVIVGGELVTRWATSGKRLANMDTIDLKGSTPSSKLAAMERDKQKNGYKFLGEREISSEGEISDSPAPVFKAKPQGFFTLTATPRPDVWDKMTHAGYQIHQETSTVEIRLGNHCLLGTVEDDGKVNIGVNVKEIKPEVMLVMLYVASQDRSAALVNAKGEPIKAIFDSLVDQFGTAAEAMRDTAEQLGLVPKSLAKALKASSGLFAFGSPKPT